MTPEQNEAFAFALIGVVALIGAFAWMPKPRWLDRLWTWAIGIAFVVWAPLGLIITLQDGLYLWSIAPMLMVVLFVYGLYDGLSGSTGTAVRRQQLPRPPDSPTHDRTSA